MLRNANRYLELPCGKLAGAALMYSRSIKEACSQFGLVRKFT